MPHEKKALPFTGQLCDSDREPFEGESPRFPMVQELQPQVFQRFLVTVHGNLCFSA